MHRLVKCILLTVVSSILCYHRAGGVILHPVASFSLPKLTDTAHVIFMAYSKVQDNRGVEHNITWQGTFQDGEKSIRQITESAAYLNGITAYWANLTVAPIVLPPNRNVIAQDKKLTIDSKENFDVSHPVIHFKDNRCFPAASVTHYVDWFVVHKLEGIQNSSSWISSTENPANMNLTGTWITVGPDSPHCRLRHNGSFGSLSRSLTSNETTDEDGIKFSELDAHKLESVANFTVDKHNCLRSRVSPSAGNMLKVEWNQEAADQAQDWADQCNYNHNNETNRTTSLFSCGQNIAYTTPWPFSWNSVINMWFNEYSIYTYGQPNDLHTVGHYTAITWATSYQLGCAYKDCGGWHYYVCHYCPNGNYGDLSVPYKTGKPCEACPNACYQGLCTNSCQYTNVYSNCDELERKYRICSSRLQERLAIHCKATCLCRSSIYF